MFEAVVHTYIFIQRFRSVLEFLQEMRNGIVYLFFVGALFVMAVVTMLFTNISYFQAREVATEISLLTAAVNSMSVAHPSPPKFSDRNRTYCSAEDVVCQIRSLTKMMDLVVPRCENRSQEAKREAVDQPTGKGKESKDEKGKGEGKEKKKGTGTSPRTAVVDQPTGKGKESKGKKGKGEGKKKGKGMAPPTAVGVLIDMADGTIGVGDESLDAAPEAKWWREEGIARMGDI